MRDALFNLQVVRHSRVWQMEWRRWVAEVNHKFNHLVKSVWQDQLEVRVLEHQHSLQQVCRLNPHLRQASQAGLFGLYLRLERPPSASFTADIVAATLTT